MTPEDAQTLFDTARLVEWFAAAEDLATVRVMQTPAIFRASQMRSMVERLTTQTLPKGPTVREPDKAAAVRSLLLEVAVLREEQQLLQERLRTAESRAKGAIEPGEYLLDDWRVVVGADGTVHHAGKLRRL